MKEDNVGLDVLSITGRTVNCVVRHEGPKEPGESLVESFGLQWNRIDNIRVYKRMPFDCPLNRGNWLIDIYYDNGTVFCIKLPLNWSGEEVDEYMEGAAEKWKKAESDPGIAPDQ